MSNIFSSIVHFFSPPKPAPKPAPQVPITVPKTGSPADVIRAGNIAAAIAQEASGRAPVGTVQQTIATQGSGVYIGGKPASSVTVPDSGVGKIGGVGVSKGGGGSAPAPRTFVAPRVSSVDDTIKKLDSKIPSVVEKPDSGKSRIVDIVSGKSFVDEKIPSVGETITRQAGGDWALPSTFFQQQQRRELLAEVEKARSVQEARVESVVSSVSDYEARVKDFEDRYGGRQLTQAQYNQAMREKAVLDAERSSISASVAKANVMGKVLEKQFQDFQVRQQQIERQAMIDASTRAQKQDVVRRVLGVSEPIVSDMGLRDSRVSIIAPTLSVSEPKGLSVKDTVITSGRDLPRGDKIPVITAGELMDPIKGYGAIGSGLTLEAQASQPFQKGRGLDVKEGIKFVGLGIASVPGRFGQLIGSGIGDVLGSKKGVKLIEDKPFIYVTSTGQRMVSEVYSPSKAIAVLKQDFKTDLFRTVVRGVSEALIMLPGATALSKIGSKSLSQVGGIKKVFIPAESLVTKPVLTGVQRFPTAKGAVQALKDFEKTPYKTALPTGKKYVYSATDYPFTPLTGRKIVVTTGRGLEKGVDVPGLYASIKGVSPYFLRIKKQFGLDYSLPTKIFPRSLLPAKPKILAIRQVPSRLPASDRITLAKAQAAFGKTPKTLALAKQKSRLLDATIAKTATVKPGKPVLSPALELGLKPEAEAVIRVGSQLKRVGLDSLWQRLTGYKFYTKIDGVQVPIYEMGVVKSVVGKGTHKIGLQQAIDAKKYASSSPLVSEKALVSSSSLSTLGAGASSVIQPISSSNIQSVSKDFVNNSSSVYRIPSSLKISYTSPKIRQVSIVSEPKYSVQPSVSSYPTPSKSSSSPLDSRVSSVSSYPSQPVYSPSVSKSISRMNSIVSQIKSGYSTSKVSSVRTPSFSSYPSYPSRVTPTTPPIVPPPPIISYPRLGGFKLSSKGGEMREAYKVVARVRGEDKILKIGVPKNLAKNVGSRFVGETPARSFKIVKVGMTTRKDVPIKMPMYKFREPVSLGSVAKKGYRFVEKTKYAIESPGEKRGIPGKAQALRRAGLLKTRKAKLPKIPKKLV